VYHVITVQPLLDLRIRTIVNDHDLSHLAGQRQQCRTKQLEIRIEADENRTYFTMLIGSISHSIFSIE